MGIKALTETATNPYGIAEAKLGEMYYLLEIIAGGLTEIKNTSDGLVDITSISENLAILQALATYIPDIADANGSIMSFQTDTFAVETTTSEFELSSEATDPSSIIVWVNNQRISPSTDFTLDGTTLTLTTPLTGSNLVEMMYFNGVSFSDVTVDLNNAVDYVTETTAEFVSNYQTSFEIVSNNAEAALEGAQSAQAAAELAENNAESAALASGANWFADTTEFLAATTDGDFGYIPEDSGVRVYENVSDVATAGVLLKETVYSSYAAFVASNEPSRGVNSLWKMMGVFFEEAASGATDHDFTNAAGVKFYYADVESLNVTVGSSGDFTTINGALEYLSNVRRSYKKNGVTAVVHLLTGFVMEEQVLVVGVDLGWITITSDDAEVTIDGAYLTEHPETYAAPAFYAGRDAVLPIIGALFIMINSGSATEGDLDNRHGVTIGAGGRGAALGGCGVKNAGARGLYVAGGHFEGNQTVWSGAGDICARCSSAGHMVIRNSVCTDAGQQGIIYTGGGGGSCEGSDVSNAGDDGLLVDKGSHVNASTLIANNCGENGAQIRCSIVDLSDSTITNNAEVGILFTQGASGTAEGSTVTGNDINIEATDSAKLDVRGVTATGYIARGIKASNGGYIEAFSVDAQKDGSDTTTDIVVIFGGKVDLNSSAQGGYNVTPGVQSEDGLITKPGCNGFQSGAGTILTGTSYVDITHNLLSGDPNASQITISFTDDPEDYWHIAQTTATTFRVKLSNDSTDNIDFNWRALESA